MANSSWERTGRNEVAKTVAIVESEIVVILTPPGFDAGRFQHERYDNAYLFLSRGIQSISARMHVLFCSSRAVLRWRRAR